MRGLTRRKLRYWCFRFHTEATGGASADEAPPGLREEVEAHPHFGGWDQFGVSWDFDPDDHTRIVPLRHSLLEQWNTQAWASARDLPTE